MRARSLALGLATLVVATSLLPMVPVASARTPCVIGGDDSCIIVQVTCVRAPCPPRVPLAEKVLAAVRDLLPGYCEPPFECQPA